LLVTGEYDQIAPPAAVEAAARTAGASAVVIPGADHGWWPGVDALSEAVRAFAAGSLQQPSSPKPAG
jgi:pimeloyl-ACP methyl ester carboxylesterase